jgi:ABC-type uncharacterized transport system substrate-binding protein
MPVIGFLKGQSAQAFASQVAAFSRGLNETGYVEGQNVAIEYRWAEGRLDRLPQLAADLVRRQVAVIAATGGNNSALVAMQATSTIPIVFTSSENPMERGLVASINRPGKASFKISRFSTARSVIITDNPVMFPPGRAKVATCPVPSGSAWVGMGA